MVRKASARAASITPRRVAAHLHRLLRQPRIPFPPAGERLLAPSVHGVYVIRDRRHRVLHVGRTIRGRHGMRQRLGNHLHARSSFVIEYLDGEGARLRGGMTFQYLPIADPRLRALVEALAVGTLCPAHLGVGAVRT